MTTQEMEEIEISQEVKNELDKLRKGEETYEEIILKLIKRYTE